MPGDASAIDQQHPRVQLTAPVLRRADNVIQVGLAAECGVMLREADDRVARFLDMLNGQLSLVAVRRRSELSVPAADALIGTLRRAGVLVESAAPPVQTVKIIGAGVLGSGIARLLAGGGVKRLILIDGAPADPSTHRLRRPGSTNAEALAAELTSAALGQPDRLVPMVAEHWTKPDGVTADLTLVATDGHECDRIVPDTLMRADEPHLLVRGHAVGVCVGPFVLPGCGPCVRCGDLHRTDRDPAWPSLLSQLRRLGPGPSTPVAAWGASTAVTQVLAWLAGHRPETWGATLELTSVDWNTRLRTWSVHPDCGCTGLPAYRAGS